MNQATRAAVEEGIVPGGGVALLKASQILKDVPSANFDQSLGWFFSSFSLAGEELTAQFLHAT